MLLLSVLLYRGGLHLVALKPRNMGLGDLPAALFLSFLRMGAAYILSILFAYTFGTLAAYSKTAEWVLLPVLDVLQSIPVIGFFPAAVGFFIQLASGHRIGIEIACVFLIFTSQAWNIAFGVYESIKAIPQDQKNIIKSFHLRPSQRFFKLDFPATIPRLVYNTILSWSNGWFFLVACEIIAIGPIQYHLPGIGSFLAKAAEQNEITLVLLGLLSLTLFILFLDFSLWRPLTMWSRRFTQEDLCSDQNTKSFSFMTFSYPFFRFFSSQLLPPLKHLLYTLFLTPIWTLKEILLPFFWDLPVFCIHLCFQKLSKWILPTLREEKTQRRLLQFIQKALWFFVFLGFIFIGNELFLFLSQPWPSITSQIPLAIFYSTLRLLLALFLALTWILPLLYWIWDCPHLKLWLTTLAQISASLPAIALFPLLILLLVQFLGGGMELATLIMLLMGMQWYLLFNALGGIATIPNDYLELCHSLGLSRFQIWKKVVLPAISAPLVTGALTTWGAGWNALVVAEYLHFRGKILSVHGIGALLSTSVYELGDHRAMSFCIATMVAWILLFNFFLWRPLYQYVLNHFKIETGQ